MCTVILRDGYWASFASTLFVMLLILKGSGVPLQEKQVTFETGAAYDKALQVPNTRGNDNEYCCAGKGAVGQ